MAKFEKGNKMAKRAIGVKKEEHIRPLARRDAKHFITDIYKHYTNGNIKQALDEILKSNPTAYLSFLIKLVEMDKHTDQFNIKMELEKVKLALGQGNNNNNQDTINITFKELPDDENE